MQSSLLISTLDHDLIEIKVQNPQKFNLEYVRDEVESLTNILGPHQIYYQNGVEVTSLLYSDLPLPEPLEMIQNSTLPVARFLINFRSRTYPVYVNNYEKKYLLCLKLAIEKKMQSLGLECPFDAQTLRLNGEEIPISCQLSELPYNAQINMDLNTFISHRPLVTTFDLEEFEEIVKKSVMVLVAKGKNYEVKVDERAAKWRRISEGFCVECYCRNRNCEARNRTVVANLGFGVFDLEILKVRIRCPLCGQVSEEIVAAGFFKAAWKYKGVLNSNVVEGEEKSWGGFYVWRDLAQEWSQLKFAVRPDNSN